MRRVLYIEDNPTAAEWCKRLLEMQRDWLLAVHKDLTSAVEALQHEHFDFIIMDVGLPDSPDPMVSIKKIKTLSGETPIVVLTGHTELGRALQDAGAFQVVFKGDPPQALVFACDIAVQKNETNEDLRPLRNTVSKLEETITQGKEALAVANDPARLAAPKP